MTAEFGKEYMADKYMEFKVLEVYFPYAFHCQIIIKKFSCTQGAHMSNFEESNHFKSSGQFCQ